MPCDLPSPGLMLGARARAREAFWTRQGDASGGRIWRLGALKSGHADFTAYTALQERTTLILFGAYHRIGLRSPTFLCRASRMASATAVNRGEKLLSQAARQFCGKTCAAVTRDQCCCPPARPPAPPPARRGCEWDCGSALLFRYALRVRAQVLLYVRPLALSDK